MLDAAYAGADGPDRVVSVGEDYVGGRGASQQRRDGSYLRKWLWCKPIGARIACKGIESSLQFGPPQVGDRTDHLLAIRIPSTQPRYEHHPRNYLAFLGLAAALCCYKRRSIRYLGNDLHEYWC